MLRNLQIELKNQIRNLWNSEWCSATSGSTTRSFFPILLHPSSTQFITARYEVLQILTGHSFLNSSQWRIGFRVDPTCACGEEIETVEHFLFLCPLFNRESFKRCSLVTFGAWPPPLEHLVTVQPLWLEMCRYIVATKRLRRVT